MIFVDRDRDEQHAFAAVFQLASRWRGFGLSKEAWLSYITTLDHPAAPSNEVIAATATLAWFDDEVCERVS
jgi:hypothetical protein